MTLGQGHLTQQYHTPEHFFYDHHNPFISLFLSFGPSKTDSG